MDKKNVELIAEVKSSLDNLKSNYLRLQVLVDDLLEKSRAKGNPSSEFVIQCYKRGNLN